MANVTIRQLPTPLSQTIASVRYFIKPKCECDGNTPRRQQFIFSFLFKQMVVARSIFTLGGWVQLFWTAFDPIFTVVPLKVALGWHKFDFWAFQKNNQASVCQVSQMAQI